MQKVLQPYEILASDATGKPTFIRFSSTKVKADDKSVVAFLSAQYGFDEHTTFVEKKGSAKEENGIFSKKLFQYYKGIQVEWGQIVITYKDNLLRSLNGNFTPTENSSIVPLTPVENAIQNTIQKIGAKEYAWQNANLEKMLREETQNSKATYYPTAELLLIDKNIHEGKTDVRLVYKLDIYALSPESHKEYYVDATTGEIIYEESLIMHVVGSGDTRYSGKQNFETQLHNGSYRLHDYTRGNGIITYNLRGNNNYAPFWDFTDNNNIWTSAEYANAARDNAALDAHWGAEKTYDYFLQKHGRNSWDGNGAKIENYVHSSIGNDWVATWNDDLPNVGRIRYGDNNGFSPWTCIDIIGHEFGHGLERSTSKLSNFEEGGSLQEGASDIWGVMVKYYANPNHPIIYINASDVSTNGIRNLSNPNARNTPDTYKGNYWNNYSSTSARHSNSTVLSHWFYLLAEGGKGTNDLGNYYNFKGIGKEKAAQIVYRGETVIFTSTTNYPLARVSMIQAAEDIFGYGSTEMKTVCQAWYAVGLGTNECSTLILNNNFGNDVICENSNRVYILFGIPKNANVTWQSSSTIQIVSSSSSQVTIKPIGMGAAYIIGSINGTPIVRKDFWIGLPQVQMITSSYPDPYYTPLEAQGINGTNINQQGITSTTWELVNTTNCSRPITLHTYDKYYAELIALCNSWRTQVKFTATNSCGTTILYKTLSPPPSPPCYSLQVQSSHAFVRPCEVDFSKTIEDKVQQISVHNYMGIQYGTYENTDSFPISKMPLGVYLVKVQLQSGYFFTLKFIKQ